MNANPPGSGRIRTRPYAVPRTAADHSPSALPADAFGAERQGRLLPNHHTGDSAMKQRTLERARRTVDAFLHQRYADTTLTVLSVHPDVDGSGEVLLVRLTYDDDSDAKGLPESLERIRMIGKLQAELQDQDVDAFPVISYTAKSEVGVELE